MKCKGEKGDGLEMQKRGEQKAINTDIMKICIALGILLCGEMFMVIMTNHYVNEYYGEHFFATGIVESVSLGRVAGDYIIDLSIDGDEYEINRPSNGFHLLSYDFGVEGENVIDAINALGVRLEDEIGRQANIEYIRENQILGLTIGDTEYLNADAVLKDHIAYQRLGRNIYAVASVITFIAFVILVFRVLHTKS